MVGRSAHTAFAGVVRTTAADALVAADDVRHQPLRTLLAPQPSHFSKLAEREAEREAESDAELEAERLAELEERLLQVCKCKAIL